MGIENYSTTAADNNSSSPNGWPEGMPPSGVNNSARQNMADTRSWYENAQWVDYGYAHVYASATSFTIATTDYTTLYHVGRRIKATGSSTGTIYGTIVTTAYSSSTTVTVSWDSGNLENEALTVYIAALSKDSDSIPYINKASADVASASTVDLNVIRGDLVDVTGTTTITAVTLAEGQERVVRFTGVLTLTDGASLVLPNSSNIATAAGDFAIFRGYASSIVRCVNYSKISNSPSVLSTGSVGDTITLNSNLVGLVIAFADDSPPSGFLECDGATISRTTYSSLFAVIGTAWGVGDGATTFNIPDLRGEFIRGWDHGRGVDPDAGSRTDRGDGTTGDNVGTRQGYQLQSHRHSVDVKDEATVNNTLAYGNTGATLTNFTNYEGGNETRPRNTALMYCVKY